MSAGVASKRATDAVVGSLVYVKFHCTRPGIVRGVTPHAQFRNYDVCDVQFLDGGRQDIARHYLMDYEFYIAAQGRRAKRAMYKAESGEKRLQILRMMQ